MFDFKVDLSGDFFSTSPIDRKLKKINKALKKLYPEITEQFRYDNSARGFVNDSVTDEQAEVILNEIGEL